MESVVHNTDNVNEIKMEKSVRSNITDRQLTNSEIIMESELLFNESIQDKAHLGVIPEEKPIILIETKERSRIITDPPKSFLYETPLSNNEIVDIYERHEFKVSFLLSAISVLKRLAGALEVHSTFRDLVEDMEPLLMSEFDRIFEQKLAMYVSLSIKDRNFLAGLYVITDNDILDEINSIVHNMIYHGYSTFPHENTIEYMLNGYPISLLTNIFQTNRINAHIMGESVLRFVRIRKTYPRWLPPELSDSIGGNIPLTGHPASPLTKNELEALYRYLGSRKNIYVHILLNTLFELNEHDKLLTKSMLSEFELITIIKSSWLYLFLFATTQNTSLNIIERSSSFEQPRNSLRISSKANEFKPLAQLRRCPSNLGSILNSMAESGIFLFDEVDEDDEDDEDYDNLLVENYVLRSSQSTLLDSSD